MFLQRARGVPTYRFRALAGAVALVLLYLYTAAVLYHFRLHPGLQAQRGQELGAHGAIQVASISSLLDHCPFCDLGRVVVDYPSSDLVWLPTLLTAWPSLSHTPQIAFLCLLFTPQLTRGPPLDALSDIGALGFA